MNRFKDFGIKPPQQTFSGDKIKIDRILNREIKVHYYRIVDSTAKPGTKRLDLQISIDGEMRVIWTGSTILMETIQQVPQEKFPFLTTIIKDNERLQFT